MFRTAAFALFSIAVVTRAQMPATGKDVPQLAVYETLLRPVFEKWKVPGAAVAITDQGRLVYARGFGFADRENWIPVQPTSMFRFASISKTLTGMTILKLAEEGKLSLDAKFMDLIPNLQPATSPAPDPRMRQVTVRQLLMHIEGFDRPVEDDHPVYYNTASRLFNAPVSKDLMTRYVISQKLDFEPGTKFAYGNSAYQILGRIIERITGKPYEDAIREKLLTPSGATGIRTGHALLENRYQDEVKYYDYPGAPIVTAPVVPGAPRPTTRPYGNNWLEMGDSYGGMVGSAIDLMKYINALDGRRGGPILSANTISSITQRPPAPVPVSNTGWTGLTWRITPITGGFHWWHSGGASGTRNLLARRQNGRAWVILTNTRPQDEDSIIDDLFAAMATAEARVTSWPAHDLFTDFAGSTLATSADVLTLTASGSAPTATVTLGLTANGPLNNITVETMVARPNALPVAAPSNHWLRVDRRSGITAPSSIAVSADPAGLDAGTYDALLRISGPNLSNTSRYVRVVLTVTNPSNVSAIRNAATLAIADAAAPGSRIVIETSEDLTSEPAKAEGIPAAGPLGGVTAQIAGLDAILVEAQARKLDLMIPVEVPTGDSTVIVTTSKGRALRGTLRIDAATPSLYSADRTGKGVALARWTRIAEDGSTPSDPTPAFACDEAGVCTATPIDLGSETDRVLLEIAATGLRNPLADPASISVQIGDELAEVVTAQPSATEAGVDLITVRLPRVLAGRGELDLIVSALDRSSNPVRIAIQ